MKYFRLTFSWVVLVLCSTYAFSYTQHGYWDTNTPPSFEVSGCGVYLSNTLKNDASAAFNAWNNIGDSPLHLSWHYASTCTDIDAYNGKNQFVWVSDEHVDGAASTTRRRGIKIPGMPGGIYLETDVQINYNDPQYNFSGTCNSIGASKDTTAVHELGHAVGLHHAPTSSEEVMSIMWTTFPTTWVAPKYCGGSTSSPLPLPTGDDAKFIRTQYPASTTVYDFAPTDFYEINGSVMQNNNGVGQKICVKPGEDFNFRYSVDNRGNASGQVEIAFYLRLWGQDASVPFDSITRTIPGHTYHTELLHEQAGTALELPSGTTAGYTYNVSIETDRLGNFTETYENNNWVVSDLKLEVRNSCP